MTLHRILWAALALAFCGWLFFTFGLQPAGVAEGSNAEVAVSPRPALALEVASTTAAGERSEVPGQVPAESSAAAPAAKPHAALVLRWDTDPTASGAPLQVEARNRGAFPSEFSTDFQGELAPQASQTFEPLAPGKWFLRTSSGHDRQVEVAAGERLEVTFSATDVVHRTVQVLGPDRRALPGATVQWQEFVLGQTDAEGLLRGVAVAPGQVLSAHADGFLRTESEPVTEFAPDPVLVHLVRPGIECRFRVGGEALAPGQRVEVEVKLLLRPPDGVSSSAFFGGQPVARLSLAQGEEAVVGGLCLGSWISALAMATELAPRHELLQLVRPTGNLVTLVLEAGGRVRGVVRDGRGEPIPGARVGLYPLGAFAGQQTLADEQGRFEVGELPAGEVRLEAVDSRRRCNLDEVVAIESGGIALWSPVIPCGAQLAGRVVDGQGAPQAGVRVVVEAPDRPGSWLGFANTALDGSFTLFEALEQDNVVRVYDDGHRELLRRTGVLGNVTDLELVVDRVWAEVHVDVRLGGQSAGQEARLLASPLGQRTGAFLQLDAEGVARSAPGTFELVLSHPGAGRIALGEQTLVAGERLELGTVQFAVPGWIQLRFPERTTATNTRVSIFDASSAEILSTTVDRLGTVRLGPFQPGAVRLELEHASGETLRFELQIRAGDTLAVEAQ